MALFINEATLPGVGDELNLFNLPQTKVGIESSSYVSYQPISVITDNSPLEFFITGNMDELIDPSRIYLYLKIRLLNENGGVFTGDENINVCNLILHSLFSQIDVILNDHQISSSNNLYSYRSYITTLLNYNHEIKKTHLATQGYFEDSPGHFNTLHTSATVPSTSTTASPTTRAINKGYVQRYTLLKNSRSLELMSPLHIDISKQNKLLLNDVNLRLKLIRSKPEFHLMGTQQGKCEIQEACLYVRKAKPNASLLQSIEQVLQTKNAMYPITKCDLKYLVIPSNVSSINRDNVLIGALPERVVIGLIKTTNFQGSKNSNPFAFDHHNVSSINLFIDGISLPSKQYSLNFSNGQYVRPYFDLMANLDMLETRNSNGLSLEDYAQSNTLYAFDLTPDQINDQSFNLIKKGNCRLEINFSQALTDSVVVILMLEGKGLIEINSSREVFSHE